MQTGCEGIRRKYDTAIFDRRQLSNGIPVWLQKSPVALDEGGKITAFLPGIGSQLDPEDQHGIAHFFEHIPFRGTLNKPSDELVVRPITMRGGKVHAAYTGYDVTAYSIVNLTQEYFDLAAETLYEIVINPRIAEEDVAAERGIILNERKMVYGEPKKVRGELLYKVPYGPGHPLDHFPIGDESVIAGMTAERLKAFHSRYYHCGNIQLLCGCAFSEMEDVIDRLERIFGGLPRTEPTVPAVDRYAFCKGPGETEVIDPRVGRDFMVFKYPLPRKNPKQPDHAALSLADALAENIDSPLVKELRVKRGIVYESGLCGVMDRRDYLGFDVFLPVTRENFALAREVFLQTLRELEPQVLLDKLQQWQLRRRIQFKDPADVCDDTIGEIVGWGQTFSFRQKEDFDDALTLDEIFAWRDYLLQAEPYIIKMRTTE